MLEGSAKTVLVVEADETARAEARAVLEATGYAVEGASDAADGIAAFRHTRPDAVVITLELPRTDGFAFLRMLRGDDRGKRVPVVMLSVDPARRAEAESLGAHAFMLKPVDMAQLVARLTTLTGGSQEPVRDDPRLPLIEEVDVRCEGWNHFVEMVTENISSGGMFVATNNPPPVFTRVRVRFAAAAGGGREVVVDGEVRHVVSPERAIARNVPAGMGVRFDALPPELLREVDGLVKRASNPKMAAVRMSAPPPQTPVPPDDLSMDELATIAKLRAVLGSMKERSFFQRLDLAPDATGAAVRKAFRNVARAYHPDRFMTQAGAIRDVAQEIYLLLAEAKKRLTDPAVRERVRRSSMDRMPRAKPAQRRIAVAHKPTPVTRSPEPRPNPQREAVKLTARDVVRAKKALAAGRYGEAKEQLTLAIQAGFDSSDVLVSLELARGHLRRADGDHQKAREHFERACQFDAHCMAAIRALRSLNDGPES